MVGAVFLKSERIELKTIEEEDIPFMVENINDPDVWSTLTIYLPANKIQEKEFLKNISKNDKEVHLMICDGDEKIGMVSIFDIDHRVRKGEIGLWISPEHWSKGYGTEASRLIVKYSFKTLNLHRVFAAALKNNQGSLKIWEKLGFEKEGVSRDATFVDGEYVDLVNYSILEDEWKER
ncbi:MAG: GNAT family N-acetyltransferase [Candidatus Saliniplasma sp.]